MKEMTGGDKILARDLFRGSNDMIEFVPQITYCLTCHQLPEVPSNDDGTWRRLRVIEFNSKFVEYLTKENEFKININLKSQICSWKTTFASYIIHIYETNVQDCKYIIEPNDVIRSTNSYKYNNDTYIEFVTSKSFNTNNEEDCIDFDELCNDFKIWIRSEKSKSIKIQEVKRGLEDIIGPVIYNKILKYKYKDI